MRKTALSISIICLGLVIFSEISLRCYFQDFFAKHPLNYYDPAIPGVAYLQIDLTKIATAKTKPRIIVVGDYISAHRSRNEGVSYPEALEKKLKGAYEVINTGTAFFSLPEEMSLLKNKMLEYEPDAIVWGYVFNDLYAANARNITILLQLKKSLFQPRIITPLALESLMRIQRLKNAAKFYRKHVAKLLMLYADEHTKKESRALLRESLTELAKIQKERRIPVVFVIIPIFVDFENRENELISVVVSCECQVAGLTCINMLDVFKRYGVEAVKEDDGDIWHHNALGGELIAQEIYDRISKLSRAHDAIN